MKTKTIFKTLAMAMLMPAMLLTTACSSEDDVVNNAANTETIAKKGYALPVTVNVTRQGDATTRATYNESTGKLAFSDDDKLFVSGSATGAGQFAGTLDYDAGSGKFSGTIYTKNLYEGTIDDLLNGNYATLLPAGYESYDYLEIIEYENEYEDLLGENANNSFATSKKLAVEQLSYEHGEYTIGTGFVLEPQNAILNFTVTGFVPNTKVTASLSDGSPLFNIEGDVTTNGSGNATFAMGVSGTRDLNDFTLTVAGNAITLVSSSKVLAAGKIYNVNRAVTPPTLAQTMTTAGMTVKVKYNYQNQNYCLFSSVGDGTYTFLSGDGYAGGKNNMAKALVVEGGKLVFKQNFFNPIDNNWSNYGFSVTFYSDNSYSQWIPDTEYGSKNYNPSFISVEVNSVPIALTQKITVSDLVKEERQYWSVIITNNSDKIKADDDYVVRISDNAKLQRNMGGDNWQDVRTFDDYQTNWTYKFEGD